MVIINYRFRLEVSFNSITPQDSGGEVSLTLKMIVPESWKDESKPPAPWYALYEIRKCHGMS